MRILITACILGVETRGSDEECCTIIMSIASLTPVSYTCVSFHYYYTLLSSEVVKHLHKHHVLLNLFPTSTPFFCFFLCPCHWGWIIGQDKKLEMNDCWIAQKQGGG